MIVTPPPVRIPLQVMQYRRVAVITSGPVAVPLDSAMVTYRATVDTGDRGAFLAEQLLRRKYAVIFIYGEGSYRPFTRIMAKRAREGRPSSCRNKRGFGGGIIHQLANPLLML